jgi:hypothetical protein
MFDQPIQRSSSEHRPLHLYANEALYWITGATLYHTRYLTCEASKSKFVPELYTAAEAWRVELIAWTLLENHWHGIVKGKVAARSIGSSAGCTADRLDL